MKTSLLSVRGIISSWYLSKGKEELLCGEYADAKRYFTKAIEIGIINKRNVVLPHNKIQQLNWKTDPIKKQFGIYTLVFKQAVSGQNKNEQIVDAPGCLTKHLELLKKDLFGNDKLSDSTKINSNPYYFRRLWIFTAWLPILLASPFFLLIGFSGR